MRDSGERDSFLRDVAGVLRNMPASRSYSETALDDVLFGLSKTILNITDLHSTGKATNETVGRVVVRVFEVIGTRYFKSSKKDPELAAQQIFGDREGLKKMYGEGQVLIHKKLKLIQREFEKHRKIIGDSIMLPGSLKNEAVSECDNERDDFVIDPPNLQIYPKCGKGLMPEDSLGSFLEAQEMKLLDTTSEAIFLQHIPSGIYEEIKSAVQYKSDHGRPPEIPAFSIIDSGIRGAIYQYFAKLGNVSVSSVFFPKKKELEQVRGVTQKRVKDFPQDFEGIEAVQAVVMSIFSSSKVLDGYAPAYRKYYLEWLNKKVAQGIDEVLGFLGPALATISLDSGVEPENKKIFRTSEEMSPRKSTTMVPSPDMVSGMRELDDEARDKMGKIKPEQWKSYYEYFARGDEESRLVMLGMEANASIPMILNFLNELWDFLNKKYGKQEGRKRIRNALAFLVDKIFEESSRRSAKHKRINHLMLYLGYGMEIGEIQRSVINDEDCLRGNLEILEIIDGLILKRQEIRAYPTFLFGLKRDGAGILTHVQKLERRRNISEFQRIMKMALSAL